MDLKQDNMVLTISMYYGRQNFAFFRKSTNGEDITVVKWLQKHVKILVLQLNFLNLQSCNTYSNKIQKFSKIQVKIFLKKMELFTHIWTQKIIINEKFSSLTLILRVFEKCHLFLRSSTIFRNTTKLSPKFEKLV